MIFMTVGTQKFQFDRLIRSVDEYVGSKRMSDDVIAQIGNGDYIPRNFTYKRFLSNAEYDEWMEKGSIIIAHSGVATIIKGVQAGKKVIVVPRLKKYGEHVDDHQRQIADAFEGLNLVAQCLDVKELPDIIEMVKHHQFEKYRSQRSMVIKTIENYINTHNADIVNKFGNFVNRTLRFKGLEELPQGIMDEKIEKCIEETYKEVSSLIEKLEIRKACGKIMELIETGNKYYDERKPWIQKNEDIEEFNNTIYTCANVIANLSNLLEPIMPETSNRIRGYLKIEQPIWRNVRIGSNISLKDIEPLFERISSPK